VIINILSIFGILLSSYALYAHFNTASICNLGDGWNCSKVLRGPRSAYFGIPNSLLGMGFYTTLLVLPNPLREFMIYTGFLATLFFAYLLFRYEDEHCIVCYAAYGINTALLLTTFL